VPIEGIEAYSREHRMAVAFPTNDGLVCVAGQWPYSEFHAVRSDVERSTFDLLDLAPGLAERVRGGRRETPFEGRFDLHNFLRRPFGAGWALVGDAGYMKDPITGQGMGDAFRDAELLVGAIDAGFSGRRPLLDGLAAYEQRRNEQVMPMYEFTCGLAALQAPPPEMQALFGALRGNQAETDRFLGTIAGTVLLQEFFAPENVQRIIAGRPHGGMARAA
jgi:2-polyprenyl-6-methoxyphenol hydroxylase-like FAD-dependent oxidoreductase